MVLESARTQAQRALGFLLVSAHSLRAFTAHLRAQQTKPPATQAKAEAEGSATHNARSHDLRLVQYLITTPILTPPPSLNLLR